MGGPTSESRGADLVSELRGMIAASYLAGDRDLTAEKRHAAAAFRAATNDALERAAALVEQTPEAAAAIRALKEAAPAPQPVGGGQAP